jgi:hypothetical protein
MSPQSNVTAILSYPYDDKFVIEVLRTKKGALQKKHYISNYMNLHKTLRLAELFCKMNQLLQKKIIVEKRAARTQKILEELNNGYAIPNRPGS